METIFSTETVHPRDKFDFWHSVACKEIVGHDCRPVDRTSFAAEIEAATLGSLKLLRFSNSPMEVTHSPAHVGHTNPDWVFVCCQLSGEAVIFQNGNEATLAAGTLALLEPLLPYEAKFLGGSKMLCIKAPRREIMARLGRSRELTARLVTADLFDDRLTLSLAAKLPSLTGKITSVTEELVGSQLLDLIAMSVARTIEGGSVRVSVPKSLMLGQIRAAIEARLADPRLDPQEVADAVGISVRYANAILAEQDTSLKRFILRRRLIRCRRAFEDPAQDHRTVGDIALGWGFSDLTHFTRRFKEAFGVRPSEYRKRAER